MLTPLTKVALDALNNIACGEFSTCSTRHTLPPQMASQLLEKLEYHGLTRLSPGQSRKAVLSYQLTRSATDITLLNVFKATGEHLNYNHETYENMYHQYGIAAHKLGIVNQITRQYLSEIRLIDL